MSMELKDTIEMMNSEDYKERFKAEYHQLCIRGDKLADMITKYKAGTLDFEPTCPLYLLEMQLEHMTHYLGIMQTRAVLEKIKLEE